MAMVTFRRLIGGVHRRVVEFLLDRPVVHELIARQVAEGPGIDRVHHRLRHLEEESDRSGRAHLRSGGQLEALEWSVGAVSARTEALQAQEEERLAELKVLNTDLSNVRRGLAHAFPKEATVDPVLDPEIADFQGQVVADIVYSGVEEQFRGSEEEVREAQSLRLGLIQSLPEIGPVIDLGCGRGEFLGLLVKAGIPAVGVDSSPAAVARSGEQGFETIQGDLLDYLRACPDASVRAVVAFQVIEHLMFGTLLRVLAESYRVLAPGGLFLAETPNGANLAVGGSTFWLDHTHVRPLHPVLLQHLAEAYGFVDVRVDLVSVPGVPWKLNPSEDLGAVGEAVLGLQEYVLSGQDALLLAYRPTEATPRRE